MFIASWEPSVTTVKPELMSAPIWLELRKVPFQFFNDEGLEHIAGLVGDPKFLHPATANKTNLEVAKVFTIIDPRKPLPEAVNVQFDSGVISRVLVPALGCLRFMTTARRLDTVLRDVKQLLNSVNIAAL